ncbi:MAG TPA: peptidylprolyl isomerase [Candidatus Limiplasma sp.]|nr:peptidylprolyl isomerase [Candidatus Limiplasma sp.]
MNKFRKAIALMLSVCLLASVTLALAESTDASQNVTDVSTGDVTTAVSTTAKELGDAEIVATVNGTNVTGADIKKYYADLVSYYGEPDETSVDLYYAVAMEQAVTMTLTKLTAASSGLDKYTDEELNTIYASSDADWQSALDNYVTNSGADVSTDDAKKTAYVAAESYYAGLGYNKDKLREQYVENSTYTRVKDMVCKDLTVTDEEVQAKYDENVANDKTTYANDAAAYESQLMMVQYGYATEKPWYHPAGYRYIKHILIPVDSTLLTTYTDLQAKLEEQMDSATASEEPTATPEATVDPSASVEPTETPVTQADVDTAKANILASVQEKTTAIYDKIAAGEDFDALIAEYGVKDDGTASDPGMTSADYPNGYEVSTSSTSFVPEFVEAAFSVDNVGDVSAPYISTYGVHIVKYMSDVPEGPVALTDALKETIRTDLLSTKQSDAMSAWMAAAAIEYTGVLKTVDEVQAAEDTAATTADDTATDAPATDAAATDAPVATDAVATETPAAQ